MVGFWTNLLTFQASNLLKGLAYRDLNILNYSVLIKAFCSFEA